MRPLTLVDPRDLQVGRQYLIEYIGPKQNSFPKYKGTFVSNIVGFCILSRFNKLIDKMNPTIPPEQEYSLQDCLHRYYEADALALAYTTHVLRSITGDPDFIYNPMPTKTTTPTPKTTK